jgi:aminopeptidase YwaD
VLVLIGAKFQKAYRLSCLPTFARSGTSNCRRKKCRRLHKLRIYVGWLYFGCLSAFPVPKRFGNKCYWYARFEKDSTVIIAAHYDHLGTGSEKSLEISGKKGIYFGADDNASGVAMMIELIKTISETKNWKYNFVFAGFSAHEAGLFGSDYFSKSTLCNSLKIRAVINFDMVGRMDTTYPTVRISGAETDKLFSNYFKSLTDNAIHFRYDDANITESDLRPFAEKKIPVLNCTTGIHSDYHKMSDTENKINYQGMEMIFELTQSMLNIFQSNNR